MDNPADAIINAIVLRLRQLSPDAVKRIADAVDGLSYDEPDGEDGPHLEEMLDERERLLTQSDLTEADRDRLGDIHEDLGIPPGSVSDWDLKARRTIHRIADTEGNGD